ncbi:MAG: ketoacyl-ACP synthase III [Oscillospiraceae bacterium]|nr:ketoacyl-ACP synthase III [Oscillospiraceae bacterium]
MSLSILGTGSALPSRAVANEEFTRIVDTSDEWIVSRTGIRSRRVITGETLTELAAAAGRSALQNAGAAADELDLILCTTIQGDYITPSLANLLQRDLGADCPAFDINAACCGFLYGLDAAQAYLAAGKARRVLLVSAEQMSKFTDWTDRATCILFGDGAAAVVLGPGEALQYIRVRSMGCTDSLHIPAPARATPFSDRERETGPSFLYMHGQNVFKFAVSSCAEGIRRALDALNLTADDIAHFLLHQANGRILDAVRRELGQPKEKFPGNLDRTGNISSASIPCLLDEMNRQGRLKPGRRLLLGAFGSGLATGTCVLAWGKE